MQPRSKHFRKRDAILACVQGTTIHPGADWVYAQLKPQFPDLSLGTVYRNLSYFKEQGTILSLGTVKGVERFDGNTAPHVHFICGGCGAVSDLPEIAVPQELAQAAAMRTGGRICGCSLHFTGLCHTCSQNENPQN